MRILRKCEPTLDWRTDDVGSLVGPTIAGLHGSLSSTDCMAVDSWNPMAPLSPYAGSIGWPCCGPAQSYPPSDVAMEAP